MLLLVIGLAQRTSAQELIVTLTASNFNGYNISCFGLKDGEVNSAVSGGVAPYTYSWSHGPTTASVNEMPAGYCKVKVTDANGLSAEADVTLSEPAQLKVDATPFKYPSGMNISCHECFNGNVDVEVTGGVQPLSYLWNDDIITQDRTGLGAMAYEVTVTDANGCVEKVTVTLQQPERGDWTMTGNANTDPSTQYIGTSDAQDVVFKSNGAEALRLKSNGDISLLGSMEGFGPLIRMDDGTLRVGGGVEWPPVHPSGAPCRGLSYFLPYWETRGNDFTALCPEQEPILGTLDERAFELVTSGLHRITVSYDGKIGMGTRSPYDQLEVHTTLPRSGLTLVNNRTDGSAHTEIRFKKGNDLRWSLGCDMEANGGQDFFIWDDHAVAKRLTIDGAGRVGIGNVTLGNSELYKLYVEGGVICRDVMVQTGAFPDYVFEPNYDLMPLDELRSYLDANHHLPGIPSAAEVEQQDGVELGDLQVRMLKVVEEQALYILQLEERLKEVEQHLAKQR